ncbi:MAG: hypothetical protein V1656_00865 [Candidatus Jorgensenbacteria bacterium]
MMSSGKKSPNGSPGVRSGFASSRARKLPVRSFWVTYRTARPRNLSPQ